MRWLVLLLLVGNVIYLGWELGREAGSLAADGPPPIRIPGGAGTLNIIDEASGLQELKPVYGWQKPMRVLAPSNSTQSRKK